MGSLLQATKLDTAMKEDRELLKKMKTHDLTSLESGVTASEQLEREFQEVGMSASTKSMRDRGDAANVSTNTELPKSKTKMAHHDEHGLYCDENIADICMPPPRKANRIGHGGVHLQ